ncbi:hypothetical protein [Actinomadura gamaensis]|uniref:Transcriptional regulator n=1 Tax=Actinomadura gamaensis TaxID=1763541 RepID=A0ABV9UEX1_9ACTN
MGDTALPAWAVRLRTERATRHWGRRKLARELLSAVGAPLDERRIRSLTRQAADWERGKHYPRDWAPWLAGVFELAEAELFGPERARVTFGANLCRLMAARDVRLRDLAATVGCGVDELVLVSQDRVPPAAGLAVRLDAELDAGGTLTALAPALPDSPPVTVETTVPHDAGDEMERRRLLLAALGLGAGAFGSSAESLRRAMDVALTTPPRAIEDWQLACTDHLYAIRTRPPAAVRDDLLLDLISVRQQLTEPGADVTELQRVQAALAMLHANVLTRLGEHGGALRWWRTAKEAADASGDQRLRVLARASEVGFGLYGQRTPDTLLRLADQAQALAGNRPSAGLATLTSSRAKALSLLGRHDEAKKSLAVLRHVVPEDGTTELIPSYWCADQVYFTESWVHSHAGEESPADQARDRVLSQDFVDYQYVANVQLHEALCTVVNGGVRRGAERAAAILDGLPPGQRSQMITESGRTVLGAVPVEQRGTAAALELAAVLSRTSPRSALPSA